jgi:5-methylcytosine-specific restriction endonuclease McrA
VTSRRSRIGSVRLRSKRRTVYARDGYACVRCGSMSNLTLDHIVPIAMGGTNSNRNLQTMCADCNAAKADRQEAS